MADICASNKSMVHHRSNPPYTVARQDGMCGQYREAPSSTAANARGTEIEIRSISFLFAAQRLPASSTEGQDSSQTATLPFSILGLRGIPSILTNHWGFPKSYPIFTELLSLPDTRLLQVPDPAAPRSYD